ncbi:MAG: FAD-dependent oxidoreductase, partial [Myxococcota bacterium]
MPHAIDPSPPTRGLLDRLLAPVLDRSFDGLDRMLDLADAKLTGRFRQVESDSTSPPRHRFTAREVKLRDAHLSRLTFAKIRRLAPIMPDLLFRILRSGRFYRKDLPTGRTEATPALLDELEAIARSHGAFDVAYLNDILPSEIFAGHAVPAPGVVLYAVEMDPEPIAQAPSFDTFVEVAKGYGRLARIGDALADHLQARGHAAYPGTALGGVTDYVALGARAGMGGIGYHGMLMTPHAGARIRIATVYTSLQGLPERTDDHDWVRDFCDRCRNCVRSCPPGAIHATPRDRDNGVGTACIEHTQCRDYFEREYGCAVCIQVCPFTTAGYATVQRGLATVDRGTVKDQRAFRVAIVGAGAAGTYTAMRLLERSHGARIDVLERNPMPHGLVRYGVAPDHPEVRSKGERFDAVYAHDRVCLLANVALGRDVDAATLREAYDVVVYATGANRSRRLRVDGESASRVVPAWDFVRWYNAHPEHADLGPALDHPTAVVVGGGNVALDVARMLVAPVEHLATTDIAAHALQVLARERIRDLHLLVRGGVSRTSWTPRELRDLLEQPGLAVRIANGTLDHDADPSSDASRNAALLAEATECSPASPAVVLHVHFTTEVVRFDAVDDALDVGLSTQNTLCAGLVVPAIGFESTPLPGVPFDS